MLTILQTTHPDLQPSGQTIHPDLQPSGHMTLLHRPHILRGQQATASQDTRPPVHPPANLHIPHPAPATQGTQPLPGVPDGSIPQLLGQSGVPPLPPCLTMQTHLAGKSMLFGHGFGSFSMCFYFYKLKTKQKKLSSFAGFPPSWLICLTVYIFWNIYLIFF